MDGRALKLVVERDPHIRDFEAVFLEQAEYAGDSAVHCPRTIPHFSTVFAADQRRSRQ